MPLSRFGFRDFGPEMLTGVGVFRVDLSARPVTVSLAPAKAKFVVMLVAYAILVAIVAGVVIGIAGERPDGVLIFFGVLIFVPVAVFTFMGFATKRSAVFDVAHVSVTETNGTIWDAFYKEYLGVRWRIHARDPGESSGDFLVIEMIHPDATKTLPLYVDLAMAGPDERRDMTAEFARALKLPVLVSPDEDEDDDEPDAV
ncbi:MAG: hypothetical protein Q7S99_06935 [Parvibaculum sp.]|nr:hypothetical protein [Parvibaculum sp.]